MGVQQYGGMALDCGSAHRSRLPISSANHPAASPTASAAESAVSATFRGSTVISKPTAPPRTGETPTLGAQCHAPSASLLKVMVASAPGPAQPSTVAPAPIPPMSAPPEAPAFAPANAAPPNCTPSTPTPAAALASAPTILSARPYTPMGPRSARPLAEASPPAEAPTSLRNPSWVTPPLTPVLAPAYASASPASLIGPSVREPSALARPSSALASASPSLPPPVSAPETDAPAPGPDASASLVPTHPSSLVPLVRASRPRLLASAARTESALSREVTTLGLKSLRLPPTSRRSAQQAVSSASAARCRTCSMRRTKASQASCCSRMAAWPSGSSRSPLPWGRSERGVTVPMALTCRSRSGDGRSRARLSPSRRARDRSTRSAWPVCSRPRCAGTAALSHRTAGRGCRSRTPASLPGSTRSP